MRSTGVEFHCCDAIELCSIDCQLSKNFSHFSSQRRAPCDRFSPGKKRQAARDAKFMLQSTFSSVETRRSWVVASVALLIMGIAFGAPWITLVALKDIAAEVRGERSIPAFASALMMWMGSGVGGILMGRIAERIGIRFTVIFGALMVAIGLALSSLGPSLPL